jgi:hypothetical protein
MKITWGLIAFNDDYFLEECLRSIIPYGRVVAAEGPIRYWRERGYTTSTDRTNQILHDYRIPTLHGMWGDKLDLCNAYMDLVPENTDYVWHIDCDEIYKANDITRVIKLLQYEGYDSVSFRMHSFYGGFERCIGGFEEDFEVHRIQRYYPDAEWATHRPPTIVNKIGIPWRDCKHLNHLALGRIGVRMYHYSYLMPTQIKRKIEFYYARAPHRGIPDYFETVYIPWVLGSEEERRKIERANQGVHDWLPHLRGSSFTYEFKGQHPEQIRDSMPKLQARFQQQLAEYI